MKTTILVGGTALALLSWSTSWALQEATDESLPAIGLDPRIESIFAESCERISASSSLHFRAHLAYDELAVAPDGSDSIETHSGTIDVAAVRPNMLRASLRSDTFAADVFFDGETVALVSPDEGAYGTMQAAGPIGAMLDTLDEATGFSPPLSDLVAADAFDRFTTGAQWGRYLGVTPISGRPCHQLLVRQEYVDWQIWIDIESKLPHKISFTYRELALAPRFTAVFTEWDLGPRLRENEFTYTAAPDSIAVPLSRSTRFDSAYEDSAQGNGGQGR